MDTNIQNATLILYNEDGQPQTPVGATSPVVAFQHSAGCDLILDLGDNGYNADNVVGYAESAAVPFATLEFTFQTQDQGTVVRRLVFGSSANPIGGTECPGPSFFCPNPPTGAGNTDVLLYLDAVVAGPTTLDYRLRVSPDDMNGATTETSDFIDDVIPGGGWVYPYHAPTFCQGGRCNVENTLDRRMFLMPVDTVVVRGQPLTKRISTTLTLRSGRTYAWDESWLSLAFSPGTRLDVASASADVTGMTFTAATPAQGWDGVHFLPGSDGTWGGNMTVERVRGTCGAPGTCLLTDGVDAAITVESASPTFDGVTISDPVVGTYQHGLRTFGSAAKPVIDGLFVQGMTGSGIYAHGGSKPRLRGEGVFLTNNDEAAVLATGTGTRVFLAAVLNGAGQLRGPQITQGGGGGVWATAGARATFSSPQGGLGFANLDDNDGRGLSATGSSIIEAGTAFTHSRNIVIDNGGNSATGNGRASGTGSTVFARCNWWGFTTPADFRVGATAGGSFDAGTWLLGDPYQNASVSCVDGAGNQEGLTSGPGGLASARGGASAARGASGITTSGFGEGDTPADRLSAALDMAPVEALAALTALIADVPGSPEAASALGVAGGLTSQEDTPSAVVSAARAMLVSYADGPDADLAHAAHAALVGVDVAAGDAAGALAHAAALVAMGGRAERSGLAAEVFVHATAGATGDALASLASLDAVGPGSDEAVAARAHLSALGVAVPAARAGAPAADDDEEAAMETMKGADDASIADGVAVALSASPNPTAGGATVTLTLREESTVRVVLLDLVGREVAVVLTGALGAGTHTAAIPPNLAPGVYAVRATGGAVVATVRLTVVR